MRSFLKSESGAAAVFIALVSPILIGFAALGSEVGLWLLTQRKLQQIADVAAYTAATRALSTTNETEIRTVANNRAIAAGKLTDDELTISLPPTTGAFAGNTSHAEVVVERELPRYLTRIFSGSNDPIVLTARAVAGVDPDSGELACMVGLGTDGVTLNIQGSAQLVMEDCAAGSNSDAEDSAKRTGNNARLTATCVSTVGETDNLNPDGVKVVYTDDDCTLPLIRQRGAVDPYAGMQMPEEWLTVSSIATIQPTTATNGQQVYRPTTILSVGELAGLPAAYFPGGLDIDTKGKPAGGGGTGEGKPTDPEPEEELAEVVFEEGLYIIDGGDFRINGNTKITGKNVSFYLMNGAELVINGSVEIDLMAYDGATNSREDPYNGILFFADRYGTELTHSLTGNNDTSIFGLLYFPNDEFKVSGGTGSNVTVKPCIRVLSARISVEGNSTIEFSENCDFRAAMPGDAPDITVLQRISLKE